MGRTGEDRRGERKGLCVNDHKWREQTPAVTCLCQPYSQLLCGCVCLCVFLCVRVTVRSQLAMTGFNYTANSDPV